MKKKQKRSMTLLEIMVVIFIIGIIGTVIGVNMKGSLEEGKAFKSEKGSKQVYEILTLEISKGNLNIESLSPADAIAAIKSSGFAVDPEKLLEDGWGKQYEILKTEDLSDIRIVSEGFVQYLKKKGQKATEIKKKYPWMDKSGCVALEEEG